MTFGQKGGRGVSAKAKKSYQKILGFFLTKGGGVSPNPKGFYQIFWHNLLKKRGEGLYKKLVVFLPFFAERGGGLGRVKKSLSEKTEVVKKGGGGGSQFFY